MRRYNFIVGSLFAIAFGIFALIIQKINSKPVILPLSVFARYDFSKAEYVKRRIKGVRVTAYNNVPNQTDSTPNIMASGRAVYEGAIAVSQDFIKSKEIRFGDLLCITGQACYIVEDCLHERFKKQVDIFTFDAKKASNTNFKADIDVWRVLK